MRIQDIDYYAAGFASEGIKIMPLAPRGKTPVTSHGLYDATLDPHQYDFAWERGCNLGVPTGGKVDVIDCDSIGCLMEFGRRLGGSVQSVDDACRVIESQIGPVVLTGRGGHIYCLPDEERRNGAHLLQLDDGWVDYRGQGGYVVAPPSIHPSGAQYRFWSAYFAPRAKAPEWLPRVTKTQSKPPKPAIKPLPAQVPTSLALTPDGYWRAALTRNLMTLSEAQEGCRNQTLNTAAFNLGQLISSEAQESEAVDRLHDVALSIGLTEHETMMSIRSGMQAGMAKAKRPEPEPMVTFGGEHTVMEVSPEGTKVTQTKIKAEVSKRITLPDVVRVMEEEQGDLLGYDLFAQRIIKRRDQTNEPPSRHGLDRWEDVDLTILALNLATSLGRDVGQDTLTAAVSIAAHKHEVHPVREYLQRCRADWDGQSRIRGFLRALGAQETKAHRLEFALWLAGAAARGMEDGPVKMDSMLILEGPQGTGKSTVVKILGGDWSMDTPLDLDQPREAYMQLAGVWIAEWPELTSFVKTAPEKLKAFLSKEFDDFRAPYGRNMTRLVRHCAFVGTTNDDMYLRDDTGNRRFWPIRCGSMLFDLAWLRANRDQIWGEAVALCDAYRQRGTGFAPAPGTETEVLAAQVQTRQQIDELADKLVATVGELWEHAWSPSTEGLFVSLDYLQGLPAYQSYRKTTIKEALKGLGGVYCRRTVSETVDYSSGVAQVKPAPKERQRGCHFDRRPSYAADYDDKDFGEIIIPTE